MRGAPPGDNHQARAGGSIPADAGSTSLLGMSCSPLKDHPRGCGEHEVIVWSTMYESGSSPRMRGALPVSFSVLFLQRIIPADAGSTSCLKNSIFLSKDHPRGCGEHSVVTTICGHTLGSSPRMRGALPCRKAWRALSGIIPADAGSTRHSLHPWWAHADHPRGCGEHLVRDYGDPHQKGSSPRMRGALVRIPACVADGRIIPADAGSTTRA